MSKESGGDITQLLHQLRRGNRDAEAELVPLIYDELRRLAGRYLRQERPDHTLQPTALVHEAYLRLIQQPEINWQNRSHFYAVAARLMRRILVDHARGHRARKRGGQAQRIDLEQALVFVDQHTTEMLALDEALDRLAAFDERQSRIVEMRFFAGLKEDEIADVLGISTRTVMREWNVARAWLYGEMSR